MRWLPLLALLAAPTQAAEPCVTGAEAQALATVALPDIIRQTGTICAGRLPADSLLRRSDSAMAKRFDAEADRAWPAARGALAKLSDPAAASLLDSRFARPLLSTLVTPLIVGRIAIKDCGTIDRLVTLLEPLPPRNVAGVIVTALQYLRNETPPAGTRNPVASVPLCPESR